MTAAELSRLEGLAQAAPGDELARELGRVVVYARGLQEAARRVSRVFEDYTGPGCQAIVDLDTARRWS